MKTLKENLTELPEVDDIKSLVLFEGSEVTPVTQIENRPGKSASLKIYHYLASQFGSISPKAAEKGLEIYAEYVEEAKGNPGAHPNIDLLFDVIANNRYLVVKALKQNH